MKELEKRQRYGAPKFLDGNNIATKEDCREQIKYYTGVDYEALEKARYEKMMKEMGLKGY